MIYFIFKIVSSLLLNFSGYPRVSRQHPYMCNKRVLLLLMNILSVLPWDSLWSSKQRGGVLASPQHTIEHIAQACWPFPLLASQPLSWRDAGHRLADYWTGLSGGWLSPRGPSGAPRICGVGLCQRECMLGCHLQPEREGVEVPAWAEKPAQAAAWAPEACGQGCKSSIVPFGF